MTVRGRPPPGTPPPPRIPTPPYDTAAEALEAQIPTNGVPLGMEAPTPVDGVPMDVPPEVSLRFDEAAPVREMTAEPGSDQADTAPRCAALRPDGTRGCGGPVVVIEGVELTFAQMLREYPDQCARGAGGYWTWCVGWPDRHLHQVRPREDRRGRPLV